MSDNGNNPPPQPRQPTPSQVIWAILIFTLLFFLAVWILQVCWNASLPKMFTGAKEITFATAFFFLIVAMIIFPRPYIVM